MRYVYIYLIINLLDGMMYVGKTINLDARWKNHKIAAGRFRDYHSKLYNAMQYYGIENFKFVKLGKFLVAMIDETEKFLISPPGFDTRRHGYNICVGGGGLGYGKDHPQYKGGEVEWKKRDQAKRRTLLGRLRILELRANLPPEQITAYRDYHNQYNKKNKKHAIIYRAKNRNKLRRYASEYRAKKRQEKANAQLQIPLG